MWGRGDCGQVVVAGGPAAGAPWPDDMLNYPAGRIADTICPIVHPRVQIWIKEQFPVWRPELPLNEKHRADITRLRDALALSDAQGTADGRYALG